MLAEVWENTGMTKTMTRTAIAAALAGPMFFASPASAETCVPADAYTEIVTEAQVIEHPAVEAVVELVWHQYTGNSDAAPALDDENWNPSPALPEGKPHQDREVGVPYQTNPDGNGNWFLYLNVVVTPAIDAYTEEIPAVIIEHPAVVCEEPTPEPTPVPEVVEEEPEGEVGEGVSLPKGEVGKGGAEIELPATGAGETMLLTLAAVGMLGLGGIAYSIGRRSSK